MATTHHSTFECKFAADPAREGVITGYASVFGTRDQGGDIVMPGAFAKSLDRIESDRRSVPILWQHDPEQPIGAWTQISEDQRGLKVEGELVLEVAKAREALALVKSRAVSGLSIGYSVADNGARRDKSGNRHLTAVNLWEASIVTFPMNRDAQIDGAKSISDIRDFEAFLRESGFSRQQAKCLASGGWKALRKPNRDIGDLSGIAAELRRATDVMKGQNR